MSGAQRLLNAQPVTAASASNAPQQFQLVVKRSSTCSGCNSSCTRESRRVQRIPTDLRLWQEGDLVQNDAGHLVIKEHGELVRDFTKLFEQAKIKETGKSSGVRFLTTNSVAKALTTCAPTASISLKRT
jgi:hypothetical protein